jgi:hypothetical protein
MDRVAAPQACAAAVRPRLQSLCVGVSERRRFAAAVRYIVAWHRRANQRLAARGATAIGARMTFAA